MDGMPRKIPSLGVLDQPELHLVLLEGLRHRIVFCIADELFITDPAYQSLCSVLEQEWPGAELMLCATHSHSASPVPFVTTDDQARIQAEQHGRDLTTAFRTGVSQSLGKLRIVEVAAGRIPFLSEHVGNRRCKLDNGSCISAFSGGPVIPPGHKALGTPDGVPAEFDLLAFRAAGEQHPMVVLTSYSSHIHFYEIPLFSAEAAGAARNALRERMPATHVIYATGFAGDMSLVGPHPIPDDLEELKIRWQKESSRLFANDFAGAVDRCLGQLSYAQVDQIRFLRLEEPGPSNGELIVIESLRIGPHLLTTVPGEMSFYWERELRRSFPGESLFCAAYNRSWMGYVATALAFEEGSYETMRGPSDRLGYPSPAARAKSATTTGAHIVERARKQQRDLFVDPLLSPK